MTREDAWRALQSTARAYAAATLPATAEAAALSGVTMWPAPIQFEEHDIAIRIKGSPDLKEPVNFELKLARKKPRPMTMLVCTGAIPKMESES